MQSKREEVSRRTRRGRAVTNRVVTNRVATKRRRRVAIIEAVEAAASVSNHSPFHSNREKERQLMIFYSKILKPRPPVVGLQTTTTTVTRLRFGSASLPGHAAVKTLRKKAALVPARLRWRRIMFRLPVKRTVTRLRLQGTPRSRRVLNRLNCLVKSISNR